MPQLHGDFSLNAANALTADLLLGPRGALARLAPTHDLSAAQVIWGGVGRGMEASVLYVCCWQVLGGPWLDARALHGSKFHVCMDWHGRPRKHDLPHAQPGT